MNKPLWSPSPEMIARTPIEALRRAAEKVAGQPLADTRALHAWSVADRASFWTLVWDFCQVIGDRGSVALADGDAMPGARFFPEARLNFAENLLRRTGPGDAIVFRAEDRVSRRLS